MLYLCMNNKVMLSKWWKTASAKAAFRRVEKAKRDRCKKLKKDREAKAKLGEFERSLLFQ